MPPRIPSIQCLRVPNAPTNQFSRNFSKTTVTQADRPKRKHQEPWQLAQANAKKAANISRRQALEKERTVALGDPVRGNPTPFIYSLNTAEAPSATESPRTADLDLDNQLNFFLDKEALEQGLERSKSLFTPADEDIHPESNYEQTTLEEAKAKLQAQHDNASEAMRRIASLSLASQSDIHRINTQRIVNVFGRHNTDNSLDPRPAAPLPPGAATPATKIPRVGVDTGSSEVQIAILTAKIKALADFQESRGRHDKNGKRNMRLLVHRRQRLLRYLEKKERGGPRFQNVVEALGLTKGAWHGEITLP